MERQEMEDSYRRIFRTDLMDIELYDINGLGEEDMEIIS